MSSERPKLLTVDTSERVREFVASERAAALVAVGAPCPDHLVHTKRLPLWIPCDPETDTAETLRTRIAERADAYRADYRAYFEAHAGEGDEAGDPDARIVLVEGLGLVAAGTTTKASRISRDLYHRAIEVMAGADALGEFVSLDAAESFAVEYWPLELYKLAQAPPPGELQGRVALITGGAGGIGGAIGDALAAAGACVVAFDLDLEGAEEAVEAYGDAGLAVSGDVTSEDAVSAAFAAAVERFGGVDIVVSNAGVASSAALEDTTLEEWERNHRILVTGYFLVARQAFRVLKAQGRGGAIVFVASKNALVAGKNAAAYSSAKAAELHLARCLAEEGGADGIRVNTVNPDAVLQGSRIWGSSWRAGAGGRLRHRARRARGVLPQAHHPRRQHLPAGHRRGRAALRLRGAVGQEHRQRAQRRRRRARGVLPLAVCGHERRGRRLARVVEHQQVGHPDDFEQAPHRPGRADDGERPLVLPEQRAGAQQHAEAAGVEELELAQVDHERAHAVADRVVERVREHLHGGDVDLAADGDPGRATDVGVRDREGLRRPLRHRAVRPRPPTRKATSARMPSANSSGWTIAPPAIAIMRSTIPITSHSIEPFLSWLSSVAADRRAVRRRRGVCRRRGDVRDPTCAPVRPDG